MLGGIGISELLLILLIVLLLFGSKKLLTLGSDLGGAIRGFRKSMSEDNSPESSVGEPHKALPSNTGDPKAEVNADSHREPKA